MNSIYEHPLLKQKYFADWNELRCKLDEARRPGIDRVVFTGGVWDLIHPGHLYYLEKARRQGHLLVVGVDTDELAGHRKKRNEINRPIIGFSERLVVLSFLGVVDFLTPVKEDIGPILDIIRPEVLVVSETTGDLPPQKYDAYRAFVQEIVALPPQAPPDSISTTARIRKTVVESFGIAEETVLVRVRDAFKELKEGILR